jgi:hypothetical protein
VTFVLACLATSWEVWRRSADPLFSGGGIGRAVQHRRADRGSRPSARFTGVDARFSVLIGVVAGMLAVLRRLATA